MERVYTRYQAVLIEISAHSSVPPEFLGALAANESGGEAAAARFEPSVYAHLKSVAEGAAPAYGGLRASDLASEVEDALHPKAGEFHALYLGPPYAARQAAGLAGLEDEALRELATSWGLTQIMGYHLVGREGTVRDLLEPGFHFRFALELLSDFAARYELDLGQEFEEMFHCWNTGSPYGATFDPEYAGKGLRRMEIYRQMAERM